MESIVDLENILNPIINGMGMALVELSIGKHRGDTKVNLVLYKSGGIGLDDLTLAQKTIRPRLELEYDRDNLSLEISSPGMSRVIKNPREYAIFSGRGIRLLIGDDWINGTLAEADESEVKLEQDGRTVTYKVNDIRKAKLD